MSREGRTAHRLAIVESHEGRVALAQAPFVVNTALTLAGSIGSTVDFVALIKNSGFQPIERDSLYNELERY